MTTPIQTKDLDRFRLEGALGEGADFEVFAATDTQTGLPVVVKRPHPTLIRRRHHNAVEQRIAKMIALRRLNDSLPHTAKMLAYTEPSVHRAYFSDDLDAEYSVMVEEHASGIPLVGSAIDGIKGAPIGVPQNLFALHPVIPHRQARRFGIVRAIIEIAQAFHDAGTLILDMRPQNIYFEPTDARITLIDIGGITEQRTAGRRHAALDLHDFYLEIMKWYVPMEPPPTDSTSYAKPHGMDSVPMFRQNLNTMIQQQKDAAAEPSQAAALHILHKISARTYPNIDVFKSDFEPYLLLLEDKYAALSEHQPIAHAWSEAMQLLTHSYWRKFRFNPQSLSAYRRSHQPHTHHP